MWLHMYVSHYPLRSCARVSGTRVRMAQQMLSDLRVHVHVVKLIKLLKFTLFECFLVRRSIVLICVAVACGREAWVHMAPSS